MSRPAPSNLRSLETLLRNLARAEQLAEGRLRRALLVSIVGQFLAGTDAGAIKGATNIELRVGTQASRVSSDLDAVRSRSLTEFRTRLESALGTGWAGFGGRVVDRGQIQAPVPDAYRPHRFEVKVEYQSRPFGTVELEVSPEEADALGEPDTITIDPTISTWFTDLGLPSPTLVPALPLDHQIAQKLHACTLPDTPTWTNDRSHDLVDLQIALQLYTGPLTRLRATCERVFTARQRHPWPPVITARDGWPERYPTQAAGLDVIEDLDGAIEHLNGTIATLID